MREMMFMVVGMEDDNALQLYEFTNAIQSMDEEDYRKKLRMPYIIATELAPHELVEASEYDESISVEASWSVASALRVIRDATPERKAEAKAKFDAHVCPGGCLSLAGAYRDEANTWLGWLGGCQTLGWSLEYVNEQLDDLYHGVRGELHDHTCKLLLMSGAYKV
jgi:hypothetical protein